MDQLNGMFKLTFRMNLLFMWVAFCLTACSQARANSDYYPDVPPEDYFIEQQLARFLREQQEQQQQQQQQQQQRRPFSDFSFKFPDRLPSSAFAVSPADPRYYDDPRSLPGADVDEEEGAGLFPRQSDDDVEIEVPDKFQTETPTVSTRQQQHQEVQVAPVTASPDDYSDIYFISIVAGASAAAALGVIGLGISWYRLQKNAKAAADVEYPAYGVTGPNKEVSPTGDRRLAQSAQMYHYQHQKQQIIAMESRVTNERNGSLSDAESEEENEEGDYTVYECPGLASTGEMEVKNPLFQDDPTPATPATMATTPASSGQPIVASQTNPESKK